MKKFSLVDSINRCQRAARHLSLDQTGAVVPMFLATASLIFAVSLGSIDVIRYTTAKARAQTALDNATLAAGILSVRLRTSDVGLLQAEAQAYFEANYPNGYLGSRIVGNEVSIQFNAAGSTLSASFSGTLPLISTGFLEVSSLGLDSRAEIQLPGVSYSEVILAVDRGYPADSKGKPTGNAFRTLSNLATQNLAQLLMTEESNDLPGVYVGVVPFSEVVNVGEIGRPWVARWTDSWGGDSRLAYTNKNYINNVWRGCIAEPDPWLASAPRALDPLTPSSKFQPVFTRVMTSLNEKGNGPSWRGIPLQGVSGKDEQVAESYTAGQLVSLTANGPQYDRRLWAEFDSFGKNKTDASFSVYGAFEPQSCRKNYKVQFLTSDVGIVKSVLQNFANEPVQGNTLLPAGLLWSWRMLHPGWRNGAAWDDSALSEENTDQGQKTIVLLASGTDVVWSDINQRPSPPIHKSDALWDTEDNSFAFRLEYDAQTCPKKGQCTPYTAVHTQNAYVPPVKPGNIPKAEDFYWQYPATSLLMANPFSNDLNPVVGSSWPQVNKYTQDLCSAIKSEGIKIFVVDINNSNSLVLKSCSSNNILYTTNELDQLRSTILQSHSTGGRLRLIR